MEQSDFLKLVGDILEVDPGTLAVTDELDALGWDSLSNISFIAEVDAQLGASVNADELAKATTVADLIEIVDASAKAS